MEACVPYPLATPYLPHLADGETEASLTTLLCVHRAAAYSKLGNYAGAVQDCERAICIDPSYSKAYGRMG